MIRFDAQATLLIFGLLQHIIQKILKEHFQTF